MRCLLARLPAGRAIAVHIDRAPYFRKTIRIHIPIVTHDHAWMLCAGLGYRMAAGEVWALNSSAEHGVLNDHQTEPRTHAICDFLPTTALLNLLAEADPGCGQTVPEIFARVAALASASA
jgi:hypothetical protein